VLGALKALDKELLTVRRRAEAAGKLETADELHAEIAAITESINALNRKVSHF
jgi:hypothetical protein